jgi:tRNA 2-thiocytidine biosynthesis protein TtcA
MNIEKKIHRRVGEAIRKHRMIEDGDRLLLAVSGGQDSWVLSHVLKEKLKNKTPGQALPGRLDLKRKRRGLG